MEIFLNLAWVALAIAIVCSWLRMPETEGSDRRRQIIAVVVLIAILFPVISVSDDLLAGQNATETDSAQRRHLLDLPGAHPVLPVAGILFAAMIDRLNTGSPQWVALDAHPPAHQILPDLPAAWNRPPPIA